MTKGLWLNFRRLPYPLKYYEGLPIRCGKDDTRERVLGFNGDTAEEYTDSSGGTIDLNDDRWEVLLPLLKRPTILGQGRASM